VFPRTHVAIDHRLCGEPLEVGAGVATVVLPTVPEMAVDATGLVHGGFVFGLADHAAMLAVNHPNVVLAGAEVRLLRPVAVGERLVARAELPAEAVEATSAASAVGEDRELPRRMVVRVVVRRGEEAVMTGDFTCVVLDRHVLAPPRAADDEGAG
jgi:acyl-coenzyme A thioesterase PaaI-like protein